MQLRINCLYQARNGDVVGPLTTGHDTGSYPFNDPATGETYVANGRTYLTEAMSTDIVREIGNTDDGWTVNPGPRAGGIPGLSYDAAVHVVRRSGVHQGTLRAAEWDWAIRDLPSDIIAYRVTTPPTIEARLAKVEAILAKLQGALTS